MAQLTNLGVAHDRVAIVPTPATSHFDDQPLGEGNGYCALASPYIQLHSGQTNGPCRILHVPSIAECLAMHVRRLRWNRGCSKSLQGNPANLGY